MTIYRLVENKQSWKVYNFFGGEWCHKERFLPSTYCIAYKEEIRYNLVDADGNGRTP